MLYSLNLKIKIKNYESLDNIFLKRVLKKLKIGFSNKSGRNSYGRITVFTKGGGFMKNKFRILDLKQILYEKGIVVSKERDWKHTGFIGCVCYYIGVFSYIILPININVGSIWKGFNINKEKASSIFVGLLNPGNLINNIELIPGRGSVLARAAGVSSFIYSKNYKNVVIKLKSGSLKKISKYCVCSLGQVSNSFHKYTNKNKAGHNRILGNRPKVRGVAMNPVDHPHGGGEGKKSNPALPKTPWGKPGKWLKKKKLNVKIV